MRCSPCSTRRPAGEDTPERLAADLLEVARQAAAFYQSSMPVTESLMAEPSLLGRHLAGLVDLQAGPHMAVRRLANHVTRMRSAGALPPEVDPRRRRPR